MTSGQPKPDVAAKGPGAGYRVFPKLRTAAATMGWGPAIFYRLDRALIKLGTGFRVYYVDLVAQPVVEEIPGSSTAARRSIVVRPVAGDDDDASIWAGERLPADSVARRHRLAQDPVCLGAFRNEELLAYIWFCLGSYEEDEMRCRFVPEPEGAASWDFDLFVYPRHRFSPALTGLWQGTYDYLRSRGYRWTMSRVDKANPAAQGAARRLGAKQLSTALFITGQRVQLTLLTQWPFVHIALGRNARPVIRLKV